jgi:ribosomal-protein-alanine N-acetyltransferase
VSGSVFLRRAAPADVAALMALEREASLHPWNQAQLVAEISRAAPDAVLVLEGRAGVRAWCAYRLAVGELAILNLAVHPRERRRGLGRFLLEAGLRRGAAAGASRALLEVRASNDAARALYSDFGFVRLGVRKDYYVEPREDALVLARPLFDSGDPP